MYHFADESRRRRDPAERQQEAPRTRAASAGCRFDRPAMLARSSLARSRVASSAMTREGREVRDAVGQQVEEDRALPDVVRRDEADQQVAGVRDAGVGEHPLQVRLRDADDRPEDHRDGRHAPRAPGTTSRCSGSNADRNTRDERRERRRLHAGRHEAGHDGRRALVGVRRPHVERHGRHLEGEADEQQPERDQRERPGARRRSRRQHAADAGRACVLPVRPYDERDAVEEERARERRRGGST